MQIFINCYPPPLQAGLLRAYQDQSVELDGPELLEVQAAAERCKYVLGQQHGVLVAETSLS